MFCYNCGKEIGDNDSFCVNCGADLKGGSSQNKANTSNNMNVTPIQVSIPSVNGVNFHAVKMFVAKLVFLAIAIITFALSKDGLFQIIDSYYMPFYEYWKIYSTSQVVEYMENEIGDEMDYEREYESGVFYEEYDEKDLSLLHIGKWCAIIGPILYLAAAVMAFLNIESFAHMLNFVGVILNIAFVILISMTLKAVLELESIMDVTDHFTDLMWWYLALNLAVYVISRIFFWGAETAKTYEGKTYSLLEKSENNTNVGSSVKASSDSWHCSECGKINPGYCGTCSCGNTKK